MAEDLVAALPGARVDRLAPSIGIPILLPDGQTLLRGPRVNVPEVIGHRTQVSVSATERDAWAKKGWVDLRPANITRWRERISKMTRARSDLRQEGSAAATLRSYMSDRFELGEVVAWIFNNEMDGYRIK